MNILKYVAVGGLGVLVLIVLAGVFKFDFLSGLNDHDVDGNKINKMKINSFEECLKAGYPIMESYPEQCSDGKNTFVRELTKKEKDDMKILAESGGGKVDGVMTVLIPQLVFDENQEDFVIEFSQYEAPKSQAVLKATYEKLFELRSNGDNVWNGLTFDSVSIDEDKMVVLKLNGTWYPAGDMSGLYFRREIEATAFQYEGVESIKVLVRGRTFDWCLENVSENICDPEKNAWITQK